MHEHETDIPIAAAAAEHERRQRKVCETLALFRLCRRMRCRRAHACRGFPGECVPRFLPLVPENARALPVAFALAREAGLSFEQALARCEPELAAFAQWHAAIRGREKVYLLNRRALARHETLHERARDQAPAVHQYEEDQLEGE